MDSFASRNWPHRPLSSDDKSEIRILKLYPGNFEDDIRCELVHVSLTSDDTTYIALSYTWGCPDNTKLIALDNKPFSVTINLESFFRHAQSMALAVAEHLPETLRTPLPRYSILRNHILQSVLQDPDLPRGFPSELGSRFSSMVQRHISEMGLVVDEQDNSCSHRTDSESCYMTFWIDAVCINQQDRTERSQQVSMMKDIYSHAQATLIWLGEARQSTEDVNLVLDFARDIRQHIQPYFEHRLQWTEVKAQITSAEFVEPRIPAIESLTRVLTRNWFSRVWIIQEVAAAQGPVIALIGFQPIQWEFLAYEAVLCGEVITLSRGDKGLDVMFSRAAANVHALRDLAKEYADIVARKALSHDAGCSEDVAGRLYSLLRRSCGRFKATEPRDVIYAILGLLGTDTIPRELLPDYNASVGYVFHQAAVYLVRHIHRIDFLKFGLRDEEHLAGVPTWVPDWRNVKVNVVEGSTSPAAANVSKDGLLLELEGMALGTVATVVYPTAIAADIASTFIGRNEQSLDAEIDLADVALGMLITFEGVQRLKSLCILQAQRDIPGHDLNGFQHAWERLWPDTDGKFQTVFEMVERRRDVDVSELMDGAGYAHVLMAGYKMEHTAITGLAITDGLQLFTARRTDSPIHSGDVVVLVRGFSTPLILRPRRDRFAFVSLCDLHSFRLEFGDEESLHQTQQFKIV